MAVARSETKFTEDNTKSSTENITRQQMYSFVYDCYWGSRGFVTGDYLFEFTREGGYAERKKQAFYRNYIKGVLNSVINPVFSEEATRIYKSDILEAFLKNVDRKGTGIQKFVKTAVRYEKLQGVTFIVMDNVQEPPITESEAIATRQFPYIYYTTGEMVYQYYMPDTTLEWISFIDGEHKTKDGNVQPRYRMWNTTESYYFIINDGIEEKVSDVSIHNLGKVPVIVTYADDTNEFLPLPPYYDICKLNLAVYNQDSEQRSLERTGAFPLLAIQDDAPETAVDIGKDSILWYGTDNSNAPEFIEPKKDTFELLINSADKNIRSLVEQANSLGATVISSTAGKSGDAYEMEFLGQNFELMTTKMQAEDIENSIVALWDRYMNTTTEYVVDYKENYKPTISDVERKLKLLSDALFLDLGDSVTAAIKVDIVNMLGILNSWEDEQMVAMRESINIVSSVV